MKKFIVFISLAAFTLLSANLAGAAIIDFQPDPADLNSLDHSYYYTWGINWDMPGNENFTQITLSFENIRNWDNGPNTLYVHLLDTAQEGVSTGWDNQGGGDYFSGQGIELFTWYNLPTSPQDLTYAFTQDEMTILAGYLSDGNFGLGFDPDCHYWNDGVNLTVQTAAAPEPGTLLLLASGLLGAGYFIRRRQKSH
jgi:hypothetical protein